MLSSAEDRSAYLVAHRFISVHGVLPHYDQALPLEMLYVYFTATTSRHAGRTFFSYIYYNKEVNFMIEMHRITISHNVIFIPMQEGRNERRIFCTSYGYPAPRWQWI